MRTGCRGGKFRNRSEFPEQAGTWKRMGTSKRRDMTRRQGGDVQAALRLSFAHRAACGGSSGNNASQAETDLSWPTADISMMIYDLSRWILR
jgi:hypothetical protein